MSSQNPSENKEVSIGGVMMDKNSWENKKSGRHRTHDGQKHPGKTKKWPSSDL